MKYKLLIFMFLFLVFGISAVGILKPDTVFSEHENRYLAEKPVLSLQSVFSGEYSSKYETYVSDQFPLRDTWIGVKTIAERAVLKQDSGGVFFARDGYLIEKHSSLDTGIADRNFSRAEKFALECAEMPGIQSSFVMAVPTAACILSQKLPPFAPVFDQNSLIHKISPSVRIDAGTILKKHQDDYIFYRTDHHWTTYGAYLAYTAWAEKCGISPLPVSDFSVTPVADDFFGTTYTKVHTFSSPDTILQYTPRQAASFSVTYDEKTQSNSLYSPKKLQERDKYAYFLDGNHALTEIKSSAGLQRRLLIIKDSYAHCFAPFAANHFEMTAMIDLRYYNGDLRQYISDNKITDVLLLYNAVSLATDTNTYKFRAD